MPYVGRELLRLALSELHRAYSPLVVVSLPCMLQRRIPTSQSAAEAAAEGIPFGASDERVWLDRYFRVAGGPPDKPYFMPGTHEWVQERYPDRALQRRRKDFEDSVFYHPSRERWALRAGAAGVLRERVVGAKPPISLPALMVWMWREREIPSLEAAVQDFIEEIGLNRDDLLETIYDATIPAAFEGAGLSDVPLTQEDLAELTGAVAPPPRALVLADTVRVIEEVLAQANFVPPQGLVERIVGGWLVQDIVVLVGPTGSGKTTLARLLARGLVRLLGEERFFSAFLAITPDYDGAQFLGYENLAGEYSAGQFAKEVLFLGEPTDPRLVVLDEWNLASIDSYFAPVLSTMEARLPLHFPGRVALNRLPDEERADLERAQPSVTEGRWTLPEDTFFIATCNSWLDEPETRRAISGPVKRRCRIIQMPNPLDPILREQGRAGLAGFCDTLLEQERTLVQERANAGRRSILDEHRAERLRIIAAMADVPEDTRERILQVAQILLQNAETRSSFTPGILKDLLLSCVYAAPGDEFAALGHEVADKVLHQLQGDPQILRVIQDVTRDFPNADEISELIRRMGGLGGERRIRPLI